MLLRQHLGVPLAVMLMVAEMTRSLSILTPALVGVGLAWLIVHHFDDTIYRSRSAAARHRSASPHRWAALAGDHPYGTRHGRPSACAAQLGVGERSRRTQPGGRRQRPPVVDAAGRFEGTVAVIELVNSAHPGIRVGDVAVAGAPVVTTDSRLDAALEAITSADMSWVSVLDDERRVVGTMSISDVVAAYREELLASAQRVSALGVATGAFELAVTERSGLAGQALRPPTFQTAHWSPRSRAVVRF